MRTLRKSLFMAAMAAALPHYMSDETAAAASSEDPNAGASAAGVSQESGTTLSATTATNASDTAGAAAGEAGNVSAASASTDTSSTSQVTDATATGGEAGNVVPGAAASTGETVSGAASNGDAPVLAELPKDDAAPQPPIVADQGAFGHVLSDAAGNVAAQPGAPTITADAHAEAKDRFAGLLAKLHQFEADTVKELRQELHAIGALLHLHSTASTSADNTGDYKSGDLS